LTLLIHPQAESQERNEIENLVKTWLESHEGSIKDTVRDEKKRLAYVVGHTQQVILVTIYFEHSGEKIGDLEGKLKRQKKVLRFRLYQKAARGEGKTLKDAPARSAQPATPDKSTPAAPAKEKAPMEKLDEKIEEILEEEVL